MPLFLLLDLAFLFSRGAEWQGQWLWTADSVAGCLIILGPFAAALAAWHVQFQGELAEGRFPFNRRVIEVFRAQYGWLSGLHGIVFFVALVVTYRANPRIDIAILHGIPQFAILAGYIALGIIVGTLVRSWFTGPLLAIGLFLVPAFHAGFVPHALVTFGGATGSPAGSQANWSFDLHHALFGLGVLLLLGLLALGRRNQARLAFVSAGVATLAGLVLMTTSWSFFATTNAERFVQRAEPLVCTSKTYTLCLMQDSVSGAGQMSKDMQAVFDSEHSLGVRAVPTGLIQVTDSQRQPNQLGATEHPISADPDTFSSDTGRRLQVVLPFLLLDARCADRSQPTAEQFQSMEIVQDYYLVALAHDQSAQADPAYHELVRLTPTQQNAWLRRTLTALNTCQISTIALPS